MKRIKLGLAFLCFAGLGCACFVSCAGQRQGVVCDEIEYRNNSMAYSPDQRVFMEEELRACREEEAKKKQASAETRRSIYERFAAQDTTKKVHTAGDSVPVVAPADSAAAPADSAVAPVDSTAVPADTAPVDSVSAATDSTVADSTINSAATENTAKEEAPQ